MKHVLLGSLLFVTLSAEKCNKTNATTSMANVMDSKWVLQTLGGNAVSTPEGMEAPWLKLGKEGNSVEGNGGCNALMGTFNLEGDKISFPGMGSTKKYCESTMSTENAFMSALKRVDQFKIDGGVLKLLGGGQELATLKGE
ncbi:MAG TPA: META domain-containing protein [Flavobacteriales bacterium]|nr:META domain-containing protein [Flavobacteriales bacterium]